MISSLRGRSSEYRMAELMEHTVPHSKLAIKNVSVPLFFFFHFSVSWLS